MCNWIAGLFNVSYSSKEASYPINTTTIYATLVKVGWNINLIRHG